MTNIQPYRISVPQGEIDDLKKRLSLARFPDELEDAGWDLGAPLADVKRLSEHWEKRYDWRAEEQKINAALPQFTADIEQEGFGRLKIHFVHQKSSVATAIPLLFLHGWPGSFLEVLKILPELVKGSKEAPAFHVVAPSLPGYGFSEGAKKKGMGLIEMSDMMDKLMKALGYPQYATQGGDWGSFVTRVMGEQHAGSVRASHFNMFVPDTPTATSAPLSFLRLLLLPVLPFSAAEQQGLARTKWFVDQGSAYYREQSTKPQTIGYAQTDSPVALLAWIYEKLHDWTDAYPWTDDEVCTWISIYWFATAGPVGGTRLYYEANHDPRQPLRSFGRYVPDVKVGVSRFPKELVIKPAAWNSLAGNVVFHADHDRGGHFAAWERPDAIVADLRSMFGRTGGAYGVVAGKSGFENDLGPPPRL